MVMAYTEFALAESLKLKLRFLALDNRGDNDTLDVDIRRLFASRKKGFVMPLDRCLEDSTQRGRRHRTGRNARDEAEARRDLITFTGDAPLGPPLGWVLLWSGVYSNIFGEYVPRPVREWGYVMWDQRRWDGLGDLVWRQWETEPDSVRQIQIDYGWRPWG